MMGAIKRTTEWLRRAASKPSDVIVFRLKQALVLYAYRLTHRWTSVSRRAEGGVARLKNLAMTPTLFAAQIGSLSLKQRVALRRQAERVRASDFALLNAQVPKLQTCDFSVDWRYEHRWVPQYFKKYDFYVKKKEPYDVKFPWELSRLHYLVPVLADQIVDTIDVGALVWIQQILERWRRENPVAYSVNWYPMEASMRAIYLAMLLDLSRQLAGRCHEHSGQNALDTLMRLLLIMLMEHAQFVWVNREFTDVRGNHFTANLVALQLADRALAAEGLGNRIWGRYADAWLRKEVLLQFCLDGVNFEKSCGYHKLVLELFVVAAISCARAGRPFEAELNERLISAAQFSDALMRPDGVATGFGDTDDALGLPFLLDSPRSHGMVIELARSWFGEPIGCRLFDAEEQLAAHFLVGRTPVGANHPTGVEVRHFVDGGYVVVRNHDNGFYFMADIGEVGMRGRGGHGHNDLLSFELCMQGVPVVVDPGCSGYTADLDKKSFYRSTAAHATVELYGEEIARFAGHWAFHNDALPVDVCVKTHACGATIQVAHEAYARIHAGARVMRIFEVNPVEQRLLIADVIDAPVDDTLVVWRYPIGVADAKIESAGVLVRCDRGIKAQILGTVPVHVSIAPYSNGYGHESLGQVLEASTRMKAGRQVFETTVSVAVEKAA